MMHTVNGSSMSIFALMGTLHFASALALVAGVFFLLYLAAKIMTDRQLKQWGIGLAIGGTLVALLSAGGMYGRGDMMKGGMRMKSEKMMEGQMMKGMMDKDVDDEKMDDDTEMMGMSMDGMTMMLNGKTGDAFDEAFIEMMIPHHQGAIDMAKLAEKNAGHAEIKKMSADILTTQQREIDQMNAWLKAWGMEN